MKYLYIAVLFLISTTIQAQICIVVEDYTPTIVGGKKVLEICPGVTIKMKAVDCANPTNPISSTPTWTLPGNELLPPGFNDVPASTPGIYVVNTSNGFDEIEIIHKPIENLNVSNPRLSNSINVFTFCENETITVTNGSSFTDFVWSLNESEILGTSNPITLKRNELPAGGQLFVSAKYTNNECTVRDTFNVIMLQLPEVNLGVDTFLCQGAPTTLVLKNKVNNYGFPESQKPTVKLFQPGQSIPISGIQFFVNTPGTHILEVPSPLVASCIVRDTIEVFEKTAPKIDPIPDQVICNNTNVTLKATIDGTTNPNDHTFRWRLQNKGEIPNNDQATLIHTPDTDNALYTVRATDSDGCYNDASVNVSWYPDQVKATVDFADTTACGTVPIKLRAEGTGGYPLYSFKWFPTTNMTDSTTANPSVTPISRDTITYSVVVSDGKDCKDTAHVTVITPDMRIDIKEGPIVNTCTNDPITLNSIITGGEAPYNIKWLEGTNVLKDFPNQMGLETQTLVELTPGFTSHKIRIEVIDNRGCPEEDEISINKTSAPSISYQNVTFPLKVCAGSSIKFPPPNYPSGNYTFIWKGSEVSNLSDNLGTPTYQPNATDLGLKTFKVQISDPTITCPGGSATVTVDVIPTPQVTFAQKDTTICLGTDAILTPIVSKTGLTYTWEDKDGQILGTNSSYTTQEKGIYKVKLSDPDAAGCLVEATKTVYTINPGNYAYILTDTLFPNDVPLILTSLNNGVNPIYTWEHTGQGEFEDNGYAESIYKPSINDSGYVSFILNIDVKCATEPLTDTFKVFFIKKERPIENLVYVPSAFAPSDLNPKNQSLMIFSQNLAEDNFQFMVFNRWGEIVFETTEAKVATQHGWNGSINNTGSMLKTDVYTYTLKGEFTDGKTFEKSGTATLLR